MVQSQSWANSSQDPIFESKKKKKKITRKGLAKWLKEVRVLA
jgi:hypothetical protein